jgi:hypothetical protein
MESIIAFGIGVLVLVTAGFLVAGRQATAEVIRRYYAHAPEKGANSIWTRRVLRPSVAQSMLLLWGLIIALTVIGVASIVAAIRA